MAMRESLSKKIRFEVFKRDKFSCQYCGRKAPDIVLNVDHIDPVAAGGTNDIINLITSCFDCNNGKSDKKLDDNSVVEKQRKQLEVLQERREQIELMFEWKKHLATFANEVNDMIINYINSKINPFSLNDNGKKSVHELIKKFSSEKVLDGIDEAAQKYIKYEEDGVSKESAEVFLSKIGAMIVVNAMPPVKQKVAYVKGIARNRFNYWDDRKGAIIINNYLDALKNYGWDDDQLLNDLEKEVILMTKEAKNWSQWKTTLEGWVSDIEKWSKPNEHEINTEDISKANEVSFYDLEVNVLNMMRILGDRVKALDYMGYAFPGFNGRVFVKDIESSIVLFISRIQQICNVEYVGESNSDMSFAYDFIETCKLSDYFDILELPNDYGYLYIIREKSNDIMRDIFVDIYSMRFQYKQKDLYIALDLCIKYCNQHYNK